MASNFFDQIVKDAKTMEKQLIGPNYPYYSYIATPAELTMSPTGTISSAANNVTQLINYIQMMIQGTGSANKNPRGPSKPMGNAFFLKTGGQCTEVSQCPAPGSGGAKPPTGSLVDRYLWINNIPNGAIPFLTSHAGIQFTDFTGLVPGMMEDLGALNPIEIIKGFMEGNNPPCQQISMKTVGQPPGGINAPGVGNLHVACGDIANIDPCDFPGGGGNPVTKIPCRATFTTMEDMKKQGLDTSFRKKQSPLTKANYNNIYIFICGLLLIYLVQKLLKKN